MSTTTLAIILFVLVQLAIGWWASRRIRGETDYLVAGRRLGWWAAGFSLFATWFGAESVMGAPAAIAGEGMAGARADPIGYAVVLIILGLFLAGPMRRTEAVTLPDMFGKRFGPTVERLTALLIIPTSLIWAAAQVRALGQIVSTNTAVDLDAAVIFATACVVVYTMMGGLIGDVMTDLIQGVVLLIGVTAVAVALVIAGGGPIEAVSAIRPEQLRFVAPGESVWTRVDTFAVPIVGALIVQETISRVLGCRTASVARKAALFGGGLYLAFGSVPVLIGLLGAPHFEDWGLLGENADTESFVPRLAAEFLHPAMFVLFMGSMIAVILSSVDSALLAVGAIVSHDVTPMVHRGATDRARLVWARGAVAAAGVASGLIALSADSIYNLVLFGDSLGTAGVAVVGVMALFTRFGGAWAACLSLAVAWAASILFEYVFPVPAPFLLSLLLAALTYAAVAACERRSSLPAAS